MKKLCMLTAAALALMLLAGCSAQEEETEPLALIAFVTGNCDRSR